MLTVIDIRHHYYPLIIRNKEEMKHKNSPSHAKPTGNHRIRRAIALLLTGVLCFMFVGAGLAYVKVNSGLSSKDINALLGNRPTKSAPTADSKGSNVLKDPFGGESFNLLVLGSDTRSGDNSGFGDEEGMRSDTTIILHVSADRKQASAISIPRDSWVSIPSCTLSDGTQTSPRTTKFNTAFALGGSNGDVSDAAACTIKTIESLTDVYIDGYVVVDFSGFKEIVDAVGGIPYTTDVDMVSPKADLKLKAGTHILDGKTALGVMRARSGAGMDGSDISRIDRQQELLIALMEKVLSSGTLFNPQTLFNVTTEVANSLTVSPEIGNVSKLAGLAYGLRGIPLQKVSFLTVPIVGHPDGANVLWREEANVLWQYLRNGDSKKIKTVSSGYGDKVKKSDKKSPKVTKSTVSD